MFRTNLFLLFVVVPIVEIALLIEVGQLLGFWPTIGLVVFTAAVGSSIAAREGTAALNKLMRTDSGSISAKLADAAIILVCGFLLLTPGILTDVVGLLGLFPLTRPLIRRAVLKQFGKRVKITSFGGGDPFGRHRRPDMHDSTAQDNRADSDDGPVVGGSPRDKPEYADRQEP